MQERKDYLYKIFLFASLILNLVARKSLENKMEVAELRAIRTQRKVKQEKCGKTRRPGQQQEEAVQRKG